MFECVTPIVYLHWGKADDRNCNYGHPKMAEMKLGKMTVTDHNSAVQLRSFQFSVTVILAIF